MSWHDLLYTSTGRLRSGWRALVFCIAALLLLNVLGIVLSVPLSMAGVTPDSSPLLGVLLSGLATAPAALAAGSWAATQFERLSIATLGLSLGESWAARLLGGFLGGVGIIVLFLLALRALGYAALSGHLPTPWEWAMLGVTACCLLVGSAGAVLLLLGYGFQTLLRGIGVPAALGVCALGYVLLMTTNTHAGQTLLQHLQANPLLYVTLLLNCLMLGLLYLRSGSLWLPIGVNAGWNFGLALFHLPLGFATPVAPTPLQAALAGDPRLIGGPLGPESGALVAVVHLLLLAGISLLPFGRPLTSRWWLWPALTEAPPIPSAWDFAIGARRYQWRLVVPEDSE